MGYASLFEYIESALGYSSSQAYERMSAMRIAFRVAEVGEKLKSGELTLTSTARLSNHAKREKLGKHNIANLALQIQGKSIREVERVLANNATVTTAPREVLKPIAKDLAELKIIIDTEFEELLKEAKELEADPTLSIAALLKAALKSHIEKRTKTKAAKVERPIKRRFRQPENTSRYIANDFRRLLWQRSGGRCEFVSTQTGRRCTSRQSIEIDHVWPIALNGRSHYTNLMHLCRPHNQGKATRTT